MQWWIFCLFFFSFFFLRKCILNKPFFVSLFGVIAEEEKGQSLPGDARWKNLPLYFFEETGNKLWLDGARPQALGT